MSFEQDYMELVNETIALGEHKSSRSGPTRSLFASCLVIQELTQGYFPLLTQRRIFYKGVFGELAAFVRGATTIREFKKWGCNYWDANAQAWPRNAGLKLEEMEVGQIYGAQWTNWEETGYNQLENLLHGLKHEPDSRRHVLSTYSPTADACLPPCHLVAQFYIRDNNFLDCQVYMRSVDLLVGLPSDVVLYSALLIQIAAALDYLPGDLTFCFGDAHVYENHVILFLEEHDNAARHALPTYTSHKPSVLDFEPKDISINFYNYSKVIQYEFNV